MLLLTLRETYTLNKLSSFHNLRRKGGKFDHRPERPKVLHRHWRLGVITNLVSRYQKGKTSLDFTEARDIEWQWHQLGHMQVCNRALRFAFLLRPV